MSSGTPPVVFQSEPLVQPLTFVNIPPGPRMQPHPPFDWTQGELLKGLRCFHSGEYFEAHEHWELVWLALPEPEKTFLQGLIQITAAFHHFQRGNNLGTVSLMRSAMRRLDGYPDVFAGIVVAPLRAAIRSWIEALESIPQSSPPPVPRLQLNSPWCQ